MQEITETLVSFKTAKLAKEKGFNIFTGKAWIKKEGQELFFVPVYTGVTNGIDYHAPTQSLLQKWLRETKKIIVLVYLYDEDREDIFSFKVVRRRGTKTYPLPYFTYEEALEKGLQEALTLITIENEKT